MRQVAKVANDEVRAPQPRIERLVLRGWMIFFKRTHVAISPAISKKISELLSKRPDGAGAQRTGSHSINKINICLLRARLPSHQPPRGLH